MRFQGFGVEGMAKLKAGNILKSPTSGNRDTSAL